MPVLLRFRHEGLTTEKYNEIVKRLENAGAGSPEGRLYHVCFGDPNNLMISDIWDSRESFERFGEIVLPMVQSLGIEPVEPEVIEVYNVIEGTRTKAAGR